MKYCVAGENFTTKEWDKYEKKDEKKAQTDKTRKVKAKNYEAKEKMNDETMKAPNYKHDADKENGKRSKTPTRRTNDIGTITGEVHTKYGVGLFQATKTEKKIWTAQATEEETIR